MNIKTTIGLAIMALLVSVAYLGWARGKLSDAGSDAATPDNAAADESVRMLAQPPLEDDSEIVKVVYQGRDQTEMIFETTSMHRDRSPFGHQSQEVSEP